MQLVAAVTQSTAQILRHMGGMEQPWVRLFLAQQLVQRRSSLTDARRDFAQACPHGRPTMRWVSPVGHRWFSAASCEPKKRRKCPPWKGFGIKTAPNPERPAAETDVIWPPLFCTFGHAQLAAVGGGASKTPAEAVGLQDAVAVLGHASM